MGSPITTHILDTSVGRPAQGVDVKLEQLDGQDWQPVGSGTTDDDGRISDLMSDDLDAGTYRISFAIGAYFDRTGQDAFYPSASIVFEVDAPDEHYHVPLLLNPFGYSTYRGS